MIKVKKQEKCPEKGRPTRGRDVSSRGPNLPHHPPSSLSLFKRRTSNQAIFFMACPQQDPYWWKRAQLLVAEKVESNPGPMWYCAICTHKITSYQTSIQCNHTTPHWIHLKLKSNSSSFICNTHQILPQKLLPTYTI